MTEEIIKSLPVLFFALIISDEHKTLLPLAMAVGIGFSILENTFQLITYIDQVSLRWAVIRVISTSLSHGFCTLTVGYGMTFIRKQKKLFYTGNFGLLSLAMTFYAVFNLLIQLEYDWIGMIMLICLYLLLGFLHRLSDKEEKTSS